MEHLSPETLGRLVGDPPTTEDLQHLDGCEECAAELEMLRQQTTLLGGLPDMRPPQGDFESLEARLAAEGLVRVGPRPGSPDVIAAPRWRTRVAAVAIFLGGALSGATVVGNSSATTEGPVAQQATANNAAGARAEVARAERAYMEALVQYRQLATEPGTEESAGDPAARYAALEYLVRAGQVAVRQAPADPFLNGLLASAQAEQQAVYRRISGAARQDGWF